MFPFRPEGKTHSGQRGKVGQIRVYTQPNPYISDALCIANPRKQIKSPVSSQSPPLLPYRKLPFHISPNRPSPPRFRSDLLNFISFLRISHRSVSDLPVSRFPFDFKS